MLQRLRTACDGLGWFIGPAVFLMVFALLSFLLVVVSRTDRLLWTGAKVIGDERQGLVFYTYKGERETLDVKGFADNPHYVVYVNKNDPTDAEADSATTRASDELFVGGPLALGAVILGVGVLRRRRERRLAASTGGFGQGLDQDFVQRKLKELRDSNNP